ncbi:hypothetical protein JCM10914A_07270 [Paenibacillus sp. JCM 10914]|uniref:hypothetical protein n=1 Tax=Paenibacillus sp. JCM 10914 TaxID=1236974 RepID=UPI0003CC8C35|nr:hypothetical protein [Paenibacillus sp. JCM 10914]GAE05768.1 hypothetical protein JCM10914_1890 [Paenibacillus sp. JCM 10914]
MLALVFLVYTLVEWFIVKRKTPREKWTVLTLIIVVSVWNICAMYGQNWPTPNQVILLLLGWLN